MRTRRSPAFLRNISSTDERFIHDLIFLPVISVRNILPSPPEFSLKRAHFASAAQCARAHTSTWKRYLRAVDLVHKAEI